MPLGQHIQRVLQSISASIQMCPILSLAVEVGMLQACHSLAMDTRLPIASSVE